MFIEERIYKMEELLIKNNQEITLTEDEIVEQSKNSVRTIADNLLKTKAYYNALAANSVMEYLKKKGLLQGDIVNLHSCSKMLVDFEIADLQLPNLHIDVRAVFDENEIFLPKKHFENKILPDIYLVMQLNEDLTEGTLLGFVEPAKINKQNQNDEYYFVNKSILTPPSKLVDLITSLPVKQQYMISDSAETAIEKLIMLYMDHDIDDVKLEKLIDYLKNSVIAREKLVEFENFERLSYMALQEFKNLDVENNDFSKYIKTLVTTDEFSQFDDKNDDLAQLFGEEPPSSTGLFVDEVEETALKDSSEVEETPINDEEDLPLTKAAGNEPEEFPEEEIEAEVFDTLDEIDISDATEEVSEEISETSEEVETVEISDVVVEEKASPLDEFEAFETVDEFDLPEELLAEEKVESQPTIEEEASPVEAVVTTETEVNEEDVTTEHEVEEPVVELEESVVETSENNLEIENPAEPVIEAELEEEVITEEDIAKVSETLSEPLAGEDLELQVDGLESVSEDLTQENVELSEETLEVSLETPEITAEEIINDIEPEKEKTEELNVVEALELDEVNLDSDTVIGLSEGVMEVKNVEEIEPADNETEEEISVEELDNIELKTDIEEQQPEEIPQTPVQDVVETVTDEDVEKAIAQSQLSGEEEKKEVNANPDLDILISGDNSEADDISLEELLSMENALSSNKDEHDGFEFDETDEEEKKEENVKTIAATSEELEMLSAELDADPEPILKDSTPEVDDTDDDDDISDFAFAVDSKPHGSGKNILVPIAALITVLGIAGAGAWYFLSHGKSSGTNIDIDNVGAGKTGSGVDVKDAKTASVEDSLTKDIQLSNDTANKPAQKTAKTPENTAATKTTEAQVPPAPAADAAVKPEPLTIQKIKKDFSQPNTYLSVSKIVWDVPEYLTYNDDFNNYLQTLGSTLKLNLSSDLLLISENTVFNKVKVKIQLKDSGKKYSAEIEEGCGTQSVDDLVLQSVKNTLNLLKPPVNSLETADEDLYISIYL